MNPFKTKPTATETVEKFINAWIEGDFEKALQYTQITWKQRKEPEHLEAILERIHLFGINEKIIIMDENPVRIIARVKFYRKDETEKVLQMWVVREKKSFQPGPKGVWGVNPASIKEIS